MKNKKLFAILTLVCFMMTLMPVAAFAAVGDTVYAEVNEDSEIVSVNEDIVVDITNGAVDSEYYVFAMKDGAVNKGFGFKTIKVTEATTTSSITIKDGIANSGTYELYVVDASKYADKVITQYNDADITRNDAANKLIKESNVVMLDKSVVVKPSKTEYTVSIDKVSEGTLKDGVLTLPADSGFTDVDVYAKLVDGDGKAVVGATLKVSTNSSAVDVTPEEAKTNAAGLAKFTVSSSIAGSFKLYVEYGTKADCELTVKSTGLDAAEIETIKEPKAPVALDSTVDVDDVDVYFNVTDANGNNTGLDEEDYKVVVTEKPVGSKITASMINLQATDNGWGFDSAETLDEEGTYIFKVVLDNGNYATATVEVKEFQKPVELVVEYPTNTVELNGKTIPTSINFVDVNGVTKAATGVELSANGYAVKNFNSSTAEVTVKSDEKYVGSKITVLAVSTKYNLTDTVELTVANEAAGVKYANTKADVAVNNTLVANIVDVDGNKVALNSAADKNNATIQYVVLEKPENAKVAVTTKNMNDLVKKGQFKVSFTASEIGTYKIQTVVRYEQAGATAGEPVVKYYSGIEEITVGNTGFEDIVVMSINSNEIVVNANKVAIDAAPIVKNDRTFVPFRALAEAFGAEVAYDEATQAVTAELNGVKVVMTIGSATYTVNGAEKTMDVAPFINGSRTMVPVRFVAEAFGIKVIPTYDENGATADILFNL